MEESIGRRPNRPARRAAGRADARVVVPFVARGHAGGPRAWLRRFGAAGAPASIARWEAEVVASPPAVAVFVDPRLNRRLYLWLAALAAYFEPRGDWIADNLRATRQVLVALPGLEPLHAQLIEAELRRRPAPTTSAERLVRAALHGVGPNVPCGVRPIDVAPVWPWLDIDALAADEDRSR